MSYNERAVNHIGDFYSLNAERAFLNRQFKQGLDFQQAQEYLLDQQTHFLEEFVGKVPRQRYHYFFDENEGMKPIGMVRPAAAEYWDLAEKSGMNSRGWADAVGFSLIDEAFLTDTVNVAYWISPPSFGKKGFGDYGFMFVFQKGEDNKVNVKVHRYEQENPGLDQSNIIMQFLSTKHALSGIGITQDPLKFLQYPLLIPGIGDFEIAQDIAELSNLKQVNFVSDKISVQNANLFQKNIIEHPLIKTWISDYVQDMLVASDDRVDIYSQKAALMRAEKTRTAIFNLAQDLQNGLHQLNPVSIYSDHSPQQVLITNPFDPLLFYSQKPAMVVGGGSCPVSLQESDFEEIIRGKNLLDNGVLNYQSASDITKASSNEKWDYHDGNCVHCHAKNVKVGPCNICQNCEKLPELN